MLPNNMASLWFQNYSVLEMVCAWWCLALGLLITWKNSSYPYSSLQQGVHGCIFLCPWFSIGSPPDTNHHHDPCPAKPTEGVSTGCSGSRWKFCVPTFPPLVQYLEPQCRFCLNPINYSTCAWLSAVLSPSHFAGGLHCDGLHIKSFLPLALVTLFRQLRKPRHACCCCLLWWTWSLEKVQIDWENLKPVVSLSAELYKRWQSSSLALEKKLDKMQRLWREAVILQQFWATK